MSKWKIYTKTGDKGTTALIGGTRVPKYHLRIEAYGTVDELNAWIGLLGDQDIDDQSKSVLLKIQDRLFVAESELATDEGAKQTALPRLAQSDVDLLEKEIDRMNEDLPSLRSFILPGGHPVVSYCHLARTVCRRAERLAIRLKTEHPVPDLVVVYLNRLSDYLFVLARYFSRYFGVEERPWNADS